MICSRKTVSQAKVVPFFVILHVLLSGVIKRRKLPLVVDFCRCLGMCLAMTEESCVHGANREGEVIKSYEEDLKEVKTDMEQ